MAAIIAFASSVKTSRINAITAGALTPKALQNRHRLTIGPRRIELACATGKSHYDVAEQFGVTRWIVNRHWNLHVEARRKAELVAGPVKFAELAEKAAAEDCSLLDYLSIIRSEFMNLFLSENAKSSAIDAATIAGRLLNTLEIIAGINGQLRAAGITINNVANVGNSSQTISLNNPDIIRLQATILRALAPHPEARDDVIKALRALEIPVSPNGHDRAELPAPVTIEHEAVA